MVGTPGALALAATGRKSSGIALALAACATYLSAPKQFNFRGKSVAITGRSRGLGFALARNLVQAGARVDLLARDAKELERAKSQLNGADEGEVIAIPCDVTQERELDRAMTQIVRAFGGIYVWINDAGSILVGPLRTMVQEDFEALLKTQIHAVWTSTQLLLPIFRKAGGGKIVNISSIGGKLAVPHLGPYSTAKFALVGLSSTTNAELASENIQVTTVFPGLMRVGSAIQAVVKGEHEEEFAWFALGSATPVISVSADNAARRILTAVARRDSQLVFSMSKRAATLVQAALPEFTAWATQVAARMFPLGNSVAGKTGAESTGFLKTLPGSGVIEGLLEGQQRENNETRKADSLFNLGITIKGSS